MNRFVIAISYHENDKPQAERLLRLIADNEPAPRADVEILIVRRFDATPMTEAMIHAAEKFKVSAFVTHTPWTGWPGGPNACARDLLNESALRVKSGEWTDVDGLLMIEPDCVPVSTAWINQLRDAWNAALADGKWAMGAWRDSGVPGGHLNGNIVVVPNLANLIDLDCITPHMAWDCQIAQQLLPRGLKTGLIKNAFQTSTASEHDIKTPDMGHDSPILYHGCKGDFVISYAERNMT